MSNQDYETDVKWMSLSELLTIYVYGSQWPNFRYEIWNVKISEVLCSVILILRYQQVIPMVELEGNQGCRYRRGKWNSAPTPPRLPLTIVILPNNRFFLR